MYLKTVAVCAVLGLPIAAAAQVPIQLDVDHASFAYGEGQSIVEIYLAFEAATLTFELDSLGYVAYLPVDLGVYRSTQAELTGTPRGPIWSDSLDLSFVIADTTDLAEGQHFVHQVRTTVPPGEYELRVDIAADQIGGRLALELRRDMLIPDYSDADAVALSDVTLATSIQRSDDRDDLFYKNSMVIRPNANQLFGSGLDRLYYYAEVYNADLVQSSAGKYTVMTYIAEANVPQPISDLQRRTERDQRPIDVLVGSFDLKKLPSSSYFLRIVILNENNEAVVEQSRKFFVYNPGVERVQQIVGLEVSFETSRYASMTEEEVDASEEHIRIIATERERNRLKGIEDLDERRRFLMDFWLKRDPNTSTPINEYREEFLARVQYANDRYTTNFDEGWRTDRGEIFIKYGAPTAIDPHLYDRDTVPYETWEYNNIPGAGQAIFVFADRDGFGMYELIHSTVTGERRLANWRAELRRGN
ncbi:MAG: GWxTD domain-containing protein [Bacteroidetes bacterium]|nr:GWxTD domain-containing protein [Bacteroidota bacterium]